MENIFIESDQEITSIIDRLMQSESQEVNLIIPPGAQLCQSSINLKLLKREADNMNKKVNLILPDQIEGEAAERIGFSVKREGDFPVEFIAQKEEKKEVKKEDLINDLVAKLSIEKGGKDDFNYPAGIYPKKIEKIRENTAKRMADIVESERRKASLKKIETEKAEPIITEEQIPKEKIYTEEEKKASEQLFKKSSSSKWPKVFFAFIILGLIVGGSVVYLAFPKSKITISPKTEEIDFNLELKGSTSFSQINESTNEVPLEEIRIEKTEKKEFTATGEEQLNQKAKGLLTVYNEYSSVPQTLVATTRFMSDEGKIFRISENITVPGAKIEEGKIIPQGIEVEVTADQPGKEYNIGPSNFTIPGFKGSSKYAGFYAKSNSSMDGGSQEKVTVVSKEDLEEAEKEFTDQLGNELEESLKEQVPEGREIIKGGFKKEISEVSFNKEEGEQSDKFTGSVTVIVKALVFNQEDLRKIVDFNLNSKISQDRILVNQTQKINWPEEAIIDWEEEDASFVLGVKELIGYKIDVNKLKEDLAGLGEIEVREYLSHCPEIQKSKITLWPFWVKKIPRQNDKINIEINYD